MVNSSFVNKELYKPVAAAVRFEQVLKNTLPSGLHTVQSEFFTPIRFVLMGGMVHLYNTPRGKYARLLGKVLNIPPARFKTDKTNQGVENL